MSEPSYRLIAKQANRSFVFKYEPFNLKTRWHYHPEIEIIYFIKGSTSAIIGDGFYEFREHDLVILGANFPHVLQESTCADQQMNEEPFGLIIQFTQQFLGEEFMLKPETQPIRQLLQRSQRGLLFGKKVSAKYADLLLSMHTLSETRKLITLLELLVELSEEESCQYLTGNNYRYDHTQDEERMRRIYEYLYQHFLEPVSIGQIADVANMTPTSFCRYFKSRTLKTFTHFMNELRIGYACRLLDRPGSSITESCFESGFNNLSYFNRQFRSIIKMSPQEYRKWKRKANGVPIT
jgi:AraC-like DNA-binding protein